MSSSKKLTNHSASFNSNRDNYIQQGDVLLIPFNGKIPQNLKKNVTNVLALGEATGHKHQITGDAEVYGETGSDNLYVIVHKPGAVLSHQEHGPITFETPGTFKVDYVREVSLNDAMIEEIQRVAD